MNEQPAGEAKYERNLLSHMMTAFTVLSLIIANVIVFFFDASFFGISLDTKLKVLTLGLSMVILFSTIFAYAFEPKQEKSILTRKVTQSLNGER